MIIEPLESISHMSCNITNEARSEALGLIKYFKTFDAIVLLTVWRKVLQCIENRNVILQRGHISLDTEINNIKALQEEMQVLRSEWDSLLNEASLVAQAVEVYRYDRRPNEDKMQRTHSKVQ